jgi:hypothetical protein
MVPVGAVRAAVAVLPPAFDQDLSEQGIEDLTIEQLFPEFAVGALAVALLPRASGLDVQGADLQPVEPSLHCLVAELGAVVRTHLSCC